MYKLYHHILCPFSRKVRAHMNSKHLEYELVAENFWLKRNDFIALNPAGQVPILLDQESDSVICGSNIIIEYLEEKHQDKNNFLGDSFVKKAETRRIQDWFDHKFFAEVTDPVLNERYLNRFLPYAKAPNSNILAIARSNLSVHFGYIDYLLETRKYLAGDMITVADFSAAAQISVLDYFSDINWQHFDSVKDWYSLIKSHKAFNEILQDNIAAITPPQWYAKLDF